MAWLSDNGDLRFVRRVNLLVVVGFPGYDGLFFEVECRWRRRCLPLQAGGVPWIVGRWLAIAHRPEEIDHRQQIADAQHRGACGRKYVQHLELLRVLVVTPRHAYVAEDELGEEGQAEADEDDQGGESRPAFGVEFAGNFWPPEMHSAEIANERDADHD